MADTASQLHRAGRRPHRRPRRIARLAARGIGTGLLVVSAYTHAHLASQYDVGPAITLGQLFIAQAIVTSLVAVWLLLRDSTAAWAVATVVMVASAAAVLLSVVTKLPAIGPFPSIYEPVWFTEKIASAASEVAFVVLALGRAALVLRGARIRKGLS
ncbi:hypothetical protein CLV47_101109 [Antricoccus suffuscus]|uniref:Uncharacterized protein n=1 Tax=Antricoccus suffuscus TaxID=1629062 RepID=A0A2T1A5U4_9ACTN|nr:hypothetical protein [Antricoccus suffuscus]PRZ43985.1 hypothetical protein CLV47_101109 [Antricoccus suffuscus]